MIELVKHGECLIYAMIRYTHAAECFLYKIGEKSYQVVVCNSGNFLREDWQSESFVYADWLWKNGTELTMVAQNCPTI